MSKRDYYEILGLKKDASQEDIKKAYRRLAKEHHPDKGGDENKFKEISESYEILSNSEKKQKYDQFGHDGSHGGHSNANDMFEEILRQHGFRGRGHRQQVRRGSDIRIRIKSTLKDILTGTNKKVKIDRQINCKECNGSGADKGSSFAVCPDCGGAGVHTRTFHSGHGMFQQMSSACETCQGEGKFIKEKCKHCRGNGYTTVSENIEFDIPAGAFDGVNFQINGVGNEPRGGGQNGNLIVMIEEIKDEILHRDGLNILCDVYVSFADAILGAEEIEVPTINGFVKIKIEAGTENGKILRLKEKGIPKIGSDLFGDQLVYINVFVPKNLSEKDKNKIEELKKIDSLNPDNKKTKSNRGILGKIIDYLSLH